MGAHKGVVLSERDYRLFNFLHKCRYADIKPAMNIFQTDITTVRHRLRKLEDYKYIGRIKLNFIKSSLYFLGTKAKIIIAETLNEDIPKRPLKSLTDKSIVNLKHHLKICDLASILSAKGYDYEIDLTVKKAYPGFKIIPDIVLKKDNELIGLEIEFEYKTPTKYAKKLSQFQNSKEFKKLIYLVKTNPETLRNKINKIDIYKDGETIDERLIMDKTKEKIEYLKLTDFELNINEYLNGNNHTQEQIKK